MRMRLADQRGVRNEFFEAEVDQTTGAILPSSRGLARAMTRPMRQAKGPRRILEVGPGTGAVDSHQPFPAHQLVSSGGVPRRRDCTFLRSSRFR